MWVNRKEWDTVVERTEQFERFCRSIVVDDAGGDSVLQGKDFPQIVALAYQRLFFAANLDIGLYKKRTVPLSTVLIALLKELGYGIETRVPITQPGEAPVVLRKLKEPG
jgi:hypothetical protein